MPLRPDSYVLNMIRSAEWFNDREINSLSTAVGKGEVDLHPNIGGDAEYLHSSDEVRVQTRFPWTARPATRRRHRVRRYFAWP